MRKATILIADDHKLIREAWTFILNSTRYKVLAAVASAEDAIQQAMKLHPEIVLLDINLPGMNGIEAIPFILSASPKSRIIAISSHALPVYVKKVLSKGASGYVTKNSSQEELFLAIDEVKQGRQYICSEIKDIVDTQLLNESGPAPGLELNSLTFRELEVIKWIKEGLSSKEIAIHLSITVKTVEVHRYNILRKLKLKNTVALIEYVNLHSSLSSDNENKKV